MYRKASVHIEEQIFGIKQNGEFAGEVYIKFRTLDDTTAAMKFNRRTMKNVKPERLLYIEMFRITMDEFELFKYHMTPQSTPIASIPTPPVPIPFSTPPVPIPFSTPPVPIPSSPIIPQVNVECDEAYMSWYYNNYLPFVYNQYGYGVQYYDPSIQHPQQSGPLNYYNNFHPMPYNPEVYNMQPYQIQPQQYNAASNPYPKAQLQ
uniref:RRM domain-containing protein n=1 Tax=Panagrolaimus davidi TaxID=227884 RepID=A0A914P186_9BILA